MKTKFRVLLGLLLLFGFSGVSLGTFTVATFSDPSNNSSNPLFTIDWDDNGGGGLGLFTGGWSGTGLTLQVPLTGNVFTDVVLEMTDVVLLNEYDFNGRKASNGTIKFFKSVDAGNPLATPILQIDFDVAWVSYNGFGGADMFEAGSVVFSGSEIPGAGLEDESFSFSFTNLAPVGSWSDGFTATSAFTSSAIPEPATIGILALGAIALYRKH